MNFLDHIHHIHYGCMHTCTNAYLPAHLPTCLPTCQITTCPVTWYYVHSKTSTCTPGTNRHTRTCTHTTCRSTCIKVQQNERWQENLLQRKCKTQRTVVAKRTSMAEQEPNCNQSDYKTMTKHQRREKTNTHRKIPAEGYNTE